MYNTINESVNHSSQFISVNVKKKLRKSQAQVRKMLRKLRLRQNSDFLIKKNVYAPRKLRNAVRASVVINIAHRTKLYKRVQKRAHRGALKTLLCSTLVPYGKKL